MRVILLAVLLLLPHIARAQCCGDCNGDGQVAINELITAVNNSLQMCAGSVTPTPLPTDKCPIDFHDDNTGQGTPDCYYIGGWNQSCGANDLEALWRSDGDVMIVDLLGFDPGLFIGAAVTGPGTAAIRGWFTQPDASDFVDLAGNITLGTNGATLAVDPSEAPFDIDQCAFARYRGQLENVIVPSATRAARPRPAIDPAAFVRVRVAVGQGPRASFQRR